MEKKAAAEKTKEATEAETMEKKSVEEKKIAVEKIKEAATGEEKPKVEKKEGASEEKAKTADDLKKITGIGPKISEILSEAGIVTYKDLAGMSTDKLKEILAEAGSRYASKDPVPWVEEAKAMTKEK